MANDFSIAKLKDDIAIIQAAGTSFKLDVSRKYFKGAQIFSEVPVTYRLALSKMLKYWSDIATETELAIRRSKGIVGKRVIPYSDIKQYIHQQNDYASVVLFLDGLIRGIQEGAIVKDKDVTFFYNDVLHRAFIGGPRSVGGILEEIADIESDKVDADQGDVAQYDSMRHYAFFHPNDFMELRNSITYVINFIVGSDIRDVPLLKKKPMLMSTCLSKVVDYITYTAATYAARICAIRLYADPYLLETATVTEGVEFETLSPNTTEFGANVPFEITRATSSLDNCDELLNVMYETIEKYNGGKLFPNKDIPTIAYDLKMVDMFKSESSTYQKLCNLNRLSQFITNGCNPRIDKDNNLDPKRFERDFGNGLIEKVNLLKHYDTYNTLPDSNLEMPNLDSPKRAREALVTWIKEKVIIPTGAGDAMKTLVQVYAYTLSMCDGLDSLVMSCESTTENGSQYDNRFRQNGVAASAQEGIELANDIYADLGAVLGEKARELYIVLAKDADRRNSSVNGMFDLDTGIDLQDPNLKTREGLRTRYHKQQLMDMGYELPSDAMVKAREEEERSSERNSFLEVYSRPFYDELMLYDEYLMSLPKYANHPFFEADNKKSFKDTLADAFNALLAIIRGLWKKITEFFKNAKFVKAADWVEKHKDELLKMNFASVEVKVVNYKKNINLPDGFDNIFQNMTKVPATAPTDAKAEPASQAWAQNLYPSPEIYQWFNASPEIGKIKYKNLIMFAENMQQANVDTTLEKEETITGQQINEMMVTWIENVTNHEALYKKWESINQSVETAIKTLKSTCDNRVAALQNTAPIPAAQAAAAASKPESPTPTTGTGESVYNQLNGRPYLEADDSTSTPAGGGTGENNNVDYKQKAKDIIGKMKGLWAQNYNDIRNGKPLVPESKMQEYNNLRTELTAIKDKLGPNDKVVNIDLYASEIPTALKAEQSSSTSGDTSTGDQGETSSEPAPSVEGRQPPENQQAEKDAAENDGGNGQTGTSEGETSGSGSTEQTQETEDDKKNAERDNAVTYYQSLVTRAQKAMLNLYTPVAGWICDMISDQYKYIQKAYNKAKGIADKTKEDNKADQRQLAVNAQNTGT